MDSEGVFTPTLGGKRQRFKMTEVKVIEGAIGQRGRGRHATVEIGGQRYAVYGRSCGIAGCMCDAEIKREESKHGL